MNFSPALKVRSNTARVSMLRILSRTSVWPPRAVGFDTSTSRQWYGAFSYSKYIFRLISIASRRLAMDQHFSGVAHDTSAQPFRRCPADRWHRPQGLATTAWPLAMHSSNVPSLSPKLSMSSSPSACSTLSITFASGVPFARLQMQPALEGAAAAPGDEERHALVVVQIRVAHRRPVQQHACCRAACRRRPACSSASRGSTESCSRDTCSASRSRGFSLPCRCDASVG